VNKQRAIGHTLSYNLCLYIQNLLSFLCPIVSYRFTKYFRQFDLGVCTHLKRVLCPIVFVWLTPQAIGHDGMR
jgi:hypothetical protein